ncbi:MAG: heme ABC transporter permease CcmC [Maricaulaceae bacterium]|nr:heme ABC transporter permease CcmC [Maricaulaceae bacterium]
MISGYANPERFDRIARAAIPVCGALAVLLLGIGIYLSLFASPPDYQQGETVRIMYVHVPSAWLGLGLYLGMGAASFVYFVWRHAVADVAAAAIAPIGAVFAALCLATGALWGQPTWGTWWVWDARLTSMLIQLLLYLGYMGLRAALEDEGQAARAGAILAMAGLINLPIVKFSVDWWASLHQPASVFRLDGPTIHASQLAPLLVMALGLSFLAAWLVFYRMRSAMIARRAFALRRAREARA